MRLQVCGTSVKIPHISLAEMKKKKMPIWRLYSPPMSNGCTSWTALEARLQVYLHGMRCEIKEKIWNANCKWEKKLTGRVLVVKNTSTHCSNNNAALNISRLQLCGVSKKKEKGQCCPLMVACENSIPQTRTWRMEYFWIRHKWSAFMTFLV